MNSCINIKVSIVVPIYNVTPYIEGCIKSLTVQTYKSIEIIIIDDGSTDFSSQICDNIAVNDRRILVIHKRNGGLSSARNAGLALASGELCMFVDGDDYLVANAVEILITAYLQTKADIVQFSYTETTDCYHEISFTPINEYVITDSKRTMFQNLYSIGGVAASACTKLYKIELFRNLTFNEGIIYEDEYMITRLLQKVNRICYIGDKLYCYYIRNDSIINSGFTSKKMDNLFVREDRMKELAKMGYFDILQKEATEYFTILLHFWSDAKEAKHKNEREDMKGKMKLLLKDNEIQVQGVLRAAYFLCKISPHFICVYYYVKKSRLKRMVDIIVASYKSYKQGKIEL